MFMCFQMELDWSRHCQAKKEVYLIGFEKNELLLEESGLVLERNELLLRGSRHVLERN